MNPPPGLETELCPSAAPIPAFAENIEASALSSTHLFQLLRAQLAAALLEWSATNSHAARERVLDLEIFIKNVLALQRSEQIDRRLALAEAKLALARAKAEPPVSRRRLVSSLEPALGEPSATSQLADPLSSPHPFVVPPDPPAANHPSGPPPAASLLAAVLPDSAHQAESSETAAPPLQNHGADSQAQTEPPLPFTIIQRRTPLGTL